MAWEMTLSCASTSVDLVNASGIKVEREAFRPTVAADKTETGITADSYRAFINAPNVADLQGFIRSTNTMFLNARQRQERNAGDRVYLNVTADGTSDVWRSEVLDGDVVPDRVITPNWANGEAWVTLNIIRRNWFEGPETAVPLSNVGDTSATTSAVDIWLNSDGVATHDNTANILGSDITGDLPGFGIATFTLSAHNFQRIFTQYGRTADVTDYWFEIGASSDAADATASGGYYLSEAATTASYNTVGGTYVSTNATTQFRIIGRVGLSAGAGTYRVIPITTTGRGNLEPWSSVYITPADGNMHVYSFGTGQVSNYSASDVYAALRVYVPGGGNVLSDFLCVAPAETVRDYYLSAESTSAGTGVITDDTVLDSLTSTVESAAVGKLGTNISATGNNKILLYPGVNQTIWVNGETWDRGSFISFTLKYRPRRSTL
jgi:hypothetical protein